ncbi:DUF6049 family protein [Bifidobacterium vansinderenii]|uniref:Uncharacterized protein n=1 Tax=Bifidobacterium vansinderenii TaxID=1984871 RepID=A0A229VWT7_9BIFI|nr:DUF6049 family protein [Bifidobacterium vansinderenii]OXN00078.1 hypothetical protein Tam10B_1651 [Bifidobacterium vansinderenii]
MPGRALRRLRVFVDVCLAMMIALAMVFAGVTPTYAADDATGKVSVSLESGTSATINGTDDYTAVVTITNGTNSMLASGEVKVLTNPKYSFNSSSLMQSWADGSTSDARLRRLNTTLATATVDSIEAGGSRTVTLTAHAKPSSDSSSSDSNGSDSVLDQFTSWGAKPLNITYASQNSDGDNVTANIHSFVTRTQDGLNVDSTPQLGLTMALPLAGSDWQVSTNDVQNLLTHDQSASATSDGNGSDASGNGNDSADAAAKSATVTSLTAKQRRNQSALASALRRHTAVQTVADSSYLTTFSGTPQIAALMQPRGFDLAFQSQTADSLPWKDAGLTDDLWKASTATDLYHSVTGDEKTTPATVAWQSTASWTTTALTAAKSQGYSAVVAETDYDTDSPTAVHTSKMVVPTNAGDMTVLTTQRDLSALAQDSATSTDAKAQAEGTTAGRMARFVAQSAFYQMERPYEDRTLLVSFGTNASATTVESLMTQLESCSWLKLASLDDLMQAQPSISGDDAAERASEVPSMAEAANTDADSNPSDSDNANATAATAERLSGQVSTLRDAYAEITRFADNVLAKDSTGDSGNGTDGTAKLSDSAARWVTSLRSAYADLALKAFSSSKTNDQRLVKAAGRIANGLFSGVSVAKPDSINIVSQSASMPVTIANSHPYAVRVRLMAGTDSEQIVSSSGEELTIPANSEVQSTLTIRVLSSGTATVTIQLQDANGQPISDTAEAKITSVLQINDWSGYAILALAVLLGLLGLWRQFHRVKDPDE